MGAAAAKGKAKGKGSPPRDSWGSVWGNDFILGLRSADQRNATALQEAFTSNSTTAQTDMGIEVTLEEVDVGCVMGPRASILREIQERSGAKMNFSADDINTGARKLSISGTPAAVYLAHFMSMARVVDHHEAAAAAFSKGGKGRGY